MQDKNWVARDISVPELEENDLLVKVEYVALNPTGASHRAPPFPAGIAR